MEDCAEAAATCLTALSCASRPPPGRYLPNVCREDSACASYVTELGSSCVHTFLHNPLAAGAASQLRSLWRIPTAAVS